MAPTADQYRALTSLVENGTLSGPQAQAVREALFGPGTARNERPANPVSILIEIVGYVGGGLILGGALLLVELNLTRLGKDNAALLLGGYALVLVLAALLTGGGPRATVALRDRSAPVRRRLVGVLFALASVPTALGVGLAIEEFQQATLAAGLASFVVAVAGYALLPTIPGVLAIAGTSVTATIGGLLVLDPQARAASTFAFVTLGLLFSAASAARLIVPRHVGLAVGAVISVVGAHLSTWIGDDRALTYSLTFLIGLILFAGYWLERATVLLALGVIATSIAIPEAVTDWTNDALSGPAILLVSGAVLVAVSGLGLWLRALRRPATG